MVLSGVSELVDVAMKGAPIKGVSVSDMPSLLSTILEQVRPISDTLLAQAVVTVLVALANPTTLDLMLRDDVITFLQSVCTAGLHLFNMDLFLRQLISKHDPTYAKELKSNNPPTSPLLSFFLIRDKKRTLTFAKALADGGAARAILGLLKESPASQNISSLLQLAFFACEEIVEHNGIRILLACISDQMDNSAHQLVSIIWILTMRKRSRKKIPSAEKDGLHTFLKENFFPLKKAILFNLNSSGTFTP